MTKGDKSDKWTTRIILYDPRNQFRIIWRERSWNRAGMFHQVRMLARSKQSCSPANPNYSGSLVTIPWTILDTIIALRSRLICAMPTDCGHHRSLEHDSTRIFIKTLYPTSRRFSLPPLPPNYKENFTNDRDLGILSSRSSFCNESKFDA